MLRFAGLELTCFFANHHQIIQWPGRSIKRLGQFVLKQNRYHAVCVWCHVYVLIPQSFLRFGLWCWSFVSRQSIPHVHFDQHWSSSVICVAVRLPEGEPIVISEGETPVELRSLQPFTMNDTDAMCMVFKVITVIYINQLFILNTFKDQIKSNGLRQNLSTLKGSY